MTDNVTIAPAATGESIAADDIGGVKYQRVKITQGIDGVSDGDVSSTNPLNVALPAATVSALMPPTASEIAAASAGVVQPVTISPSGNATTATLSTDSTSSAAAGQTILSTSGATTTQLLAANTSRKGLVVYNNTNQSIYISFGSTATATNYTDILPPAKSLRTNTMNPFSGLISAYLASACVAGNAINVTEFV